ncbi:cysteine-rich with EGF-like domain protein 2 [Neodiprion pinetum]|uniref:Cysteine-rich with EGF-like domain protein 2 n=1 Tax=Neodiprion lecontei TaxID=441921 RepID=A0A6J0B5H0_NEOLC|nr:cysteine-rich with EGF-like domain protein 2 [Neodiprion lecontei]XP_046482708.1 cysteine-rich with EGF-like domain protein 2 [Neodiprion pinetum]
MLLRKIDVTSFACLTLIVLMLNHVDGTASQNEERAKTSKGQVRQTKEQLKQTKEQLRAVKLPPCAACRALVESFTHGMQKTARGKFEGGDTAWEEEKLRSYAKSEVRLVEIQENLCKVNDRGADQCHLLAEETESDVEDWWFNHQDSKDLHTYLCIDLLQHCCPDKHFGPECLPCEGYPDNICNNNGKCKGAGTRKGNGQCTCDEGYFGTTCEQCLPGYFESYRDEVKFLCTKCHLACDGNCTEGGPKACQKCNQGWEMIEEKGCIDINECLVSGKKACVGNKFCVNKEGSFDCLDCDKACDGCTGDGPDMCIKCIEGHRKKDNICVDSDLLGRKKTENIARYSTYFGLCLATCIILQRNVYAASLIGLLVGIYISVSEYMIAFSTVQDTSANMDILGPAV